MSLAALLSLVATFTSLIVGQHIYLRSPKDSTSRSFVALCVTNAIYAFAEFQMRQAESLQAAVLWLKVTSVFPLSLALLFYFALSLSGRLTGRGATLGHAIAIVPAVALAIIGITTGDLRSGVIRMPWGWEPMPGHPSLVFRAYSVWSLLMFLLVLLLLLDAWLRASDLDKRRQAAVAASGVFFAVALSDAGVFVTRAHMPIPGLASAGFVLSNTLAGLALHRLGLFNLTPSSAVDTIVRTMQDGLVLIDSSRTIRVVNDAACTLSGYRRQDLVNTPVNVLLPDICAVPSAGSSGERDWLDSGKPGLYEMSLARHDRTALPVSIAVSNMSDRRGHSIGAVLLIRDESETKASKRALERYREHLEDLVEQRTQALEQANWMLEQEVAKHAASEELLRRSEATLSRYALSLERRNKEVRDFAYVMSHDLREPLVTVQGFAGELRHAIRDLVTIAARAAGAVNPVDRAQAMALVENDIPEALGFIEQATNQMDSMLAALLELSRLGQGPLHPARVNVRDCVDDALWTLRDQIQEAGAQVEIGTLPVVVADRDALEMILLNLFSNAVKYRDESRPALIHVSAEKQVDCVVLSIADNGRGIADDDMPKVFSLFRRAGNDGIPGTGAGLPYCRTLVERHGGEIWCESTDGEGTTFHFSLPEMEADGGDYVAQ